MEKEIPTTKEEWTILLQKIRKRDPKKYDFLLENYRDELERVGYIPRSKE